MEKGIRTVNMLGCHDGIPMLDLKGLVPEERIQALIDLIVSVTHQTCMGKRTSTTR